MLQGSWIKSSARHETARKSMHPRTLPDPVTPAVAPTAISLPRERPSGGLSSTVCWAGVLRQRRNRLDCPSLPGSGACEAGPSEAGRGGATALGRTQGPPHQLSASVPNLHGESATSETAVAGRRKPSHLPSAALLPLERWTLQEGEAGRERCRAVGALAAARCPEAPDLVYAFHT